MGMRPWTKSVTLTFLRQAADRFIGVGVCRYDAAKLPLHLEKTRMRNIAGAALIACACLIAQSAGAEQSPRARDLGVPFEGLTGPLNAITDVEGVQVGQVSIIEDLPGDGAVRTGVTAVLPLGDRTRETPVFGGWFSLNGNGEMTGTTWVRESGFLEGPVMITNTHSVGAVH